MCYSYFYRKDVYDMTKGQKIRLLRERMGMSQVELAQRVNVSKQTLYKYENDIITNIPSDKIELIASVLNTEPGYIMGWGNTEQSASKSSPHPDLRPVTTKQYKVLGSVACGQPIFMAEQMDVTVDAENIPKADYVLTAKGDSMINIGIHDGDLVFVHAQPMVENGQVAVVAIGDEATLKRFYYYQEKDLMILKPENPACRDIIKTGRELEDVRILGRAVKFLTDVR